MLHSQAEPALGAGKHCAGGQHDFPQPWWSMCGVWNFIAVTESLLFFNFIFTSKCGRMASATVTATGTWWRRNRSPRLALLVFFTTSHPYLWEAVVMFLPLPYLSPTHCMCVCVCVCVCAHNFPCKTKGKAWCSFTNYTKCDHISMCKRQEKWPSE